MSRVPVPTSDVISWILSLGWDGNQETGAPLFMGPYVPDEPDKIVVLTPVSGAGYIREGAMDVSGFQARVRGPQGGDGAPDAQMAAEALAYRLDRLIFAAAYPVTLASGQVIVHVHRLSGVPAPLGVLDDADRAEFVCQYLVEVSN